MPLRNFNTVPPKYERTPVVVLGSVRVLVVQRALRIGFTLAELAEVLKARDAGGVPCQRVYELAQGKLKAIEADIEALKRTKRYLQKVLANWEDAPSVRVRGGNRTCCTPSVKR